MSIATTVNTQKTLPFPSSDERFPTFRFISSGTTTGDATGGNVALTLELGLTRAGILSGLIYGVKSLFSRLNVSGGGVGSVETALWQYVEQQVRTSTMNFALNTVDNQVTTLHSLANVNTVLGRQGGPAASASMTFRFENNINLAIYEAYVEGFIWQPIAALQGGPLFPGDFPTP